MGEKPRKGGRDVPRQSRRNDNATPGMSELYFGKLCVYDMSDSAALPFLPPFLPPLPPSLPPYPKLLPSLPPFLLQQRLHSITKDTDVIHPFLPPSLPPSLPSLLTQCCFTLPPSLPPSRPSSSSSTFTPSLTARTSSTMSSC